MWLLGQLCHLPVPPPLPTCAASISLVPAYFSLRDWKEVWGKLRHRGTKSLIQELSKDCLKTSQTAISSAVPTKTLPAPSSAESGKTLGCSQAPGMDSASASSPPPVSQTLCHQRGFAWRVQEGEKKEENNRKPARQTNKPTTEAVKGGSVLRGGGCRRRGSRHKGMLFGKAGAGHRGMDRWPFIPGFGLKTLSLK